MKAAIYARVSTTQGQSVESAMIFAKRGKLPLNRPSCSGQATQNEIGLRSRRKTSKKAKQGRDLPSALRVPAGDEGEGGGVLGG